MGGRVLLYLGAGRALSCPLSRPGLTRGPRVRKCSQAIEVIRDSNSSSREPRRAMCVSELTSDECKDVAVVARTSARVPATSRRCAPLPAAGPVEMK